MRKDTSHCSCLIQNFVEKMRNHNISGVVVCTACYLRAAYSQTHILNFANTDSSVRSYFGYKTNAAKPIISGHRGSHIADYPENAIETFDYVLKHTPAFFEIDPRLTKDSVIVLLHDATLDRTTTGKGKLADYTWEEVKKLQAERQEWQSNPLPDSLAGRSHNMGARKDDSEP